MEPTSSENLIWAGEFGRYQWMQYLLLVMPAFTCGINEFSQVMVGATPTHKCLPLENDTILDYVDSCNYISSQSNKTIPCEDWEYDKTHYGDTIVTDWNLVCNRRWMEPVSISIFFLGSFLSSVYMGQLSDQYGRWKVLVRLESTQIIFSIACGLVSHYAIYVVLRFFVSISIGATYTIAFVITSEMVPDKYRTLAGFMFQTFYALGTTAVAGWSYIFRYWPVLQIVLGLHSSILFLHWWFLDESPRWLYSQGRLEEAGAIVSKQLKMNKKEMDPSFTYDQLKYSLSNNTSSDQLFGNSIQYGVRDLFRTPRLRLRTLIITLDWFATSLAYYGLSLNTDSLVGEPHLMLFISGIIEIPAYLLTYRITDVLGRRAVISFSFIGGGLACIITNYFPTSSFAWTTSTIVITMLGKALIAIAFAIAYNYTCELFPTVVRSSATGLGVASVNVATTITPLIFLLDSLDPKIPLAIFGVVAITAGFFSLFLPETKDSPLMNTLEEGEDFGKGDTAFSWLKKIDN